MATFLLEIGTEELPADFVRSALPQLEQVVRRDLLEARLGHGELQLYGTPRRLAVQVSGLPQQQADLREERKGPPAGQAFQNGEPTGAALGFARRCGVDPAALEVRETPKGPFVYATCLEAGQPTAAVLADRIPGWIASLQGRRFMRWGDGETRFSRPLRWLVALLDEAVIPLQLAGSDPIVVSGRQSRGHRLREDALTLSHAASYREALEAAGVTVDRQARLDAIAQAIAAAAAVLQGRPDLPDELLEELVDLVEDPQLLEGSVADRFLALPPEVLSTVMRTHQRYVPLVQSGAVEDPLALQATGTLVPRFLCIANGLGAAAATIRRGNERVLGARLADAEFFLQADRSTPSIDRRDRLATVTFAEGLGSLLDRTERLEWCTDVLLQHLPLAEAEAGHARRAAHLCKHDLVCQMVGEFPELQGVMGGKYLLAEGEPRPVALAMQEHYLPRFAGDRLPGSPAGALLALAERLELLLSIFAKGERPSGSSDPYALRRAGNGVLQILWSRQWPLDLLALLERCTRHWAQLLPALAVDPLPLQADLAEFLRQRLVSLLEEEFDADLVQAVAGSTLAVERVLGDPADARRRALLLADQRRTGALAALQAVVTRAARLAEHSDLDGSVLSPAGVVEAALFEQPSEASMLAVLEALEPIASRRDEGAYPALALGLSQSSGALADFFDGEHSVLVMVEDERLRRNRLNLLAVLRNQAAVLADFSRLAG